MPDFHALHRPGDPLLLANAWDVASALALAQAGFAAIGTTSLGVAAAHGLPDGQAQGKDQTLALVRALHGRLAVPLTVDLEGGFGGSPAEVAALAAELQAAGAAGINLEDGRPGDALADPAEQNDALAGPAEQNDAPADPAEQGHAPADHGEQGHTLADPAEQSDALADPAEQAAQIAAVKRACPGLFVNARTDVFWSGSKDLGEALERLAAYRAAGADGIYVPGVAADDDIRALVATRAPLNVLLLPTMTIRHLAGLGVARISTGSLLFRVALSAAVATAREIAAGAPAEPATMTYAETNALAFRKFR